MEQKIVFTLEQVNKIINFLGALPYSQSAPMIEFIKEITVPQLVQKEDKSDAPKTE